MTAGDGSPYISPMETFASRTRDLLPLDGSPVRSLLRLAGGESFVVGTDSGSVALWTRRGIAISLVPHSRSVTALAENGELLATGGLDSRIRVWALPEGVPRYEMREHRRGIAALAFGSGGRYMVSVGLDGACRVYASMTGEELFFRNLPRRRMTFLLPLAERALSGGLTDEVTLWSFPGMEEINTSPTGAPLVYTGAPLEGLDAFITADYNQNLILWDRWAKPIGVAAARTSGRTCLAVDDQERLVAIFDGRRVEIYTLPDLTLVTRFRHIGRQGRAIMLLSSELVAIGDRRGVLSWYPLTEV